MEQMLINWIREEVEAYCDLDKKPLYVYDVTDFRLHQGLEDDDWYIEDLKALDGYMATIIDCEFVVSSKEFSDLGLIYKYE